VVFWNLQRRYEEKKTHNMFFLMLDPKFKSLFLIYFLGQEEGVSIVEEYDRCVLYPMF
jgi:hypothetical protein